MEVKNIDKQTIFLSENESKDCLVWNIGIKKNSIYFTWNRKFYVFDLDISKYYGIFTSGGSRNSKGGGGGGV